jgi:hypothetical protein
MNNLIRRPGQQMFAPPAPGTRDGNWVWDGSNWVCDPDCDNQFPQPCPPFGPPVFSGPAGQPPWYPGANGGVSFGATAPPNPVRGHMWWNGTTFFLFDGAAWVPFGGSVSGATTPPSTTAPANPQPGQQWFNGTTLFVWDGNAWVPVSQTKTTIAATAPSAPNPGDLWFDGTQLRIWDGSAWELVGPGATVGPVPTTTEVLHLYSTVNVTTPAAWTIVPFTDLPSIDTMAAWSATTHQFTPKKAGVYLFLCSLYCNLTINQAASMALVKNDTGSFVQTSQYNVLITSTQASGTFSTWIEASGMVRMNGTTDFVRLWGQLTQSLLGGTTPNIQAFLMP